MRTPARWWTVCDAQLHSDRVHVVDGQLRKRASCSNQLQSVAVLGSFGVTAPRPHFSEMRARSQIMGPLCYDAEG